MKTDNELIAEFMGGKLCDYPDGIFDAKGYYCHNGAWWNRNNLAYHERWDWLMPVVEKIGNLWEPMTDLGISVEHVTSQPIASHIQQVYKSVVEFIKWYNEQKAISSTMK